jgi:hypothetical protein
LRYTEPTGGYTGTARGCRGKPEGVAGIEIRWALLDHYPARVAELSNSAFDTASPWVKDFDEADRDKRVYYCGRWEVPAEGARGLSGKLRRRLCRNIPRECFRRGKGLHFTENQYT